MQTASLGVIMFHNLRVDVLGAIVGGVLVGLFEALSSGYLSSQYKDATAFMIIVLVLLLRPSGLFGKPTYERV